MKKSVRIVAIVMAALFGISILTGLIVLLFQNV